MDYKRLRVSAHPCRTCALRHNGPNLPCPNNNSSNDNEHWRWDDCFLLSTSNSTRVLSSRSWSSEASWHSLILTSPHVAFSLFLHFRSTTIINTNYPGSWSIFTSFVAHPSFLPWPIYTPCAYPPVLERYPPHRFPSRPPDRDNQEINIETNNHSVAAIETLAAFHLRHFLRGS